MVPFSSVSPSTHDPRQGWVWVWLLHTKGRSWDCEFMVSFTEALSGPMQTFEETVFLLENTFTKYWIFLKLIRKSNHYPIFLSQLLWILSYSSYSLLAVSGLFQVVREVTMRFLLNYLIKVFIRFSPGFTAVIINKPAVTQIGIPQIRRPESTLAGSLHVSPQKARWSRPSKEPLEPESQSQDGDLCYGQKHNSANTSYWNFFSQRQPGFGLWELLKKSAMSCIYRHCFFVS